MDISECIKSRHSVRAYEDKPLSPDIVAKLEESISSANRDGSLSCRLIRNDKTIFDTILNHYGWFKNVSNVIVLAGKDAPDLEERTGYYGERIVLAATALGLGTCWVAGTYKKKNVPVSAGEKLVCVIAVGYPMKPGKAHKSKSFSQVSITDGPVPDWFKNGVESALLAPTAINQQKFCFVLEGSAVEAKIKGTGSAVKVDLGIVKEHFEEGAGRENFHWKS